MARISPSIVADDPLDLLADLAKVEFNGVGDWEKEVWPFPGLGRAHEAERRVQERRMGLRKRAMTSGVN